MKKTKGQLEKIYQENLNKEACEILRKDIIKNILATAKSIKIINATLTKYLREDKIDLKGSGNRTKRRKLTIL